MALIQGAELVQRLAAHLTIQARRIREEENRVAAIAKLDSLMLRRQKARAPQAVVERLIVLSSGAERSEHHVSRQILVRAAESIPDPGADAGPPRELRAGLHE